MRIPGNTKQMSIGYQNMYLNIKNRPKRKIRMGIPGQTGKNAIGISENVLTYQKHEFNEKSGWKYLEIPKKCLYGIRIRTYLSKTCLKRKIRVEIPGNTGKKCLWNIGKGTNLSI